MQSIHSRQLRISLAAAFAMLMCLAGLGLFSCGPADAQGATPTVHATPAATALPDVAALMAEAQRVESTAAENVQTVSTMLSFIQVLGVVVSVGAIPLGAAALAIGARTIGQYRQELNRVNKEFTVQGEQLEQARIELQKAQTELTDMRSSLISEVTERIESLAQLETNISQRTETLLRQGDTAILSMSLLQLGRQQVTNNNLHTALQLLTEAHDLDPDSPATNYFLGDLYIRLGEPDKGIEYLNIANSGKEYVPMEAALAYALRMKGDRETDPSRRNRFYAQAEERFLKIMEKHPGLLDINGEAMIGSLGGLYRRENRYVDAIRSYEQARAATPDSPYPVSKLAILHALQGNQGQAREHFERTITLARRALDGDPTDTWARSDLITALVALGRADEALNALGAGLDYDFDEVELARLREALETLHRLRTPPDGIEAVLARTDELIKASQSQVDLPG